MNKVITNTLRQYIHIMSLVLITVMGFTLLGSVQAAALFADTTRSQCTTLNCQAAVIDKAVIISEQPVSGIASTMPWTGQFYSSGNECVRVEVIATDPSGSDLTMHFVGPDLSVWRDDDSAGNRLPLIKANTLTPGRYTVVVGLFDPTSANTNTRFKLSYGRYQSGNPNCNIPSVPLN